LPQDLAHYRRLLEDQAAELQRLLAETDEFEELGSLKDSLQELSFYDNHPADIGTETFERSKDIALRDLNKEQLANVRQALQRLKAGNFGLCLRCGREIPAERLEAVPAAAYCLDCQEQAESDLVLKRSTAEPESNFPRQDFEEPQTQDDYDAWQAVSNYGTSSELADAEHENDRRQVEDDTASGDVEAVPYWRSRDGVFYQDFRGRDDESPPGGPV
jgi:YteA family regulatory protein